MALTDLREMVKINNSRYQQIIQEANQLRSALPEKTQGNQISKEERNLLLKDVEESVANLYKRFQKSGGNELLPKNQEEEQALSAIESLQAKAITTLFMSGIKSSSTSKIGLSARWIGALGGIFYILKNTFF